MAKDPVCGMQVDEMSVEKSAYGGQTYYFCSRSCKQQFEQDPGRYYVGKAEEKPEPRRKKHAA